MFVFHTAFCAPVLFLDDPGKLSPETRLPGKTFVLSCPSCKLSSPIYQFRSLPGSMKNSRRSRRANAKTKKCGANSNVRSFALRLYVTIARLMLMKSMDLAIGSVIVVDSIKNSLQRIKPKVKCQARICSSFGRRTAY